MDELALRKRIFSLEPDQFPGFEENEDKPGRKNTSGTKNLSTISSQNEFSKVSEGRKSNIRKSFKNMKREEIVQVPHESPAIDFLEDEDEKSESEEKSLDQFD